MNHKYLTLEWTLINIHLNNLSEKIFEGYEKGTLNSLAKRFIIFNYLVENYTYDWDLYNTKCDLHQGIHPYESMFNLVTEKKGLCSSLTPIYKFLLEREQITSICCYCNPDDFKNKHMTLLVKDENGWSFDDVSSMIISNDSIEKLFGYDLEDALNLKIPQRNMIGAPSSFIDNMYGKPLGIYIDEKRGKDLFIELPKNINKIPSNQLDELLFYLKNKNHFKK